MTELQLEFIRIFGRKELTEGCYVKYIFLYNPEIEGEEELGRIRTYDGRRWATLFEGYNVDDFSAIGHPVQWHDVFARLTKCGYSYYELVTDKLEVWDELGIQKDYMVIPCNPCLSPMEQNELMQELLLITK